MNNSAVLSLRSDSLQAEELLETGRYGQGSSDLPAGKFFLAEKHKDSVKDRTIPGALERNRGGGKR